MKFAFEKLFLLIIISTCTLLLPLSSSAQLYAPSGSVAGVTNGTTNVGIGTPAPPSTLMIYSNTSEPSSFAIQHSPGTRFWISHSNADDIFKIGGTGSTRPSMGAINIKWGNVGIGTEPLSSKKMVVNGSVGIITSGYADLSLERTDNDSKLTLGITSNSEEGFISSKGELKFLTNLSTTPKMFITKGGDVGIGTTLPSAILNIVNNKTEPYQNSVRIDSNNPSEHWLITAQSNGKGNYSGLFAPATNNISLLLRDASKVVGAKINSNGPSYFNGGNVGIGTTSPDEMLSVNGTVHAKEVRVDLDFPAPDYVFEQDYPLMSLSETEKYIQANKHLPEVPSAKEMEQNGVKLLEMNMLLLKKVEELTLHVISLEKEVQTLKSKE
ncbi:hypothetical protein QWY31_08170 [Cytophagales bacterium LB-30]|uniref:Tail fiber domain-containing protein n=1 Tax=Shiella aurantiaca TaxID=3058365 RepID=A0ABT8F4T9_9BACT|nr:hypothetical protein [Shiella aurantiaca]MDN4165472.1 hypothetical protein [Shiella aurantiaca]